MLNYVLAFACTLPEFVDLACAKASIALGLGIRSEVYRLAMKRIIAHFAESLPSVCLWFFVHYACLFCDGC